MKRKKGPQDDGFGAVNDDELDDYGNDAEEANGEDDELFDDDLKDDEDDEFDEEEFDEDFDEDYDEDEDLDFEEEGEDEDR